MSFSDSSMDPSPATAPSTPTEPAQVTSALFRDPDADIAFLSSDKVLFRIHSIHLNSSSAGLAAPQNAVLGPEPVPLPETSKILGILFQFIEPPSESRNYRQPSVLDMDPTLFFDVAEAAEKYIVYGAMNVCLTRMKLLLSKHPLDVLNHCAKHGYSDLANEAAKESLSQSLTLAALRLTAPGVLPRWLIYYNKWREGGRHASDYFQERTSTCHAWTFLHTFYLRQIDKNPSSFSTIPPRPVNVIACNSPDPSCPCRSIHQLTRFRWDHAILGPMRARIPKFSTITV